MDVVPRQLARRHVVRALVAAPAMLVLTKPLDALAQDAPVFGGLQDPGNVFISPCGRPFRAKMSAPYPVVNWFKGADANGDGKLDHAEFMADTMAFFKVLDRNGDGVIGPQEVNYYEQRVAPEVLGMRVEVRGGVLIPRPLLQTVQGMPGGGGGPGGGVGQGTGGDNEGESHLGAEDPADIFERSKPYDASGAGASPYSFFDEPEPVAAADLHFRGEISKEDFRNLAEIHFKTLDPAERGYLTLDTLPKTPVQKRLERASHRRR